MAEGEREEIDVIAEGVGVSRGGDARIDDQAVAEHGLRIEIGRSQPRLAVSLGGGMSVAVTRGVSDFEFHRADGRRFPPDPGMRARMTLTFPG